MNTMSECKAIWAAATVCLILLIAGEVCLHLGFDYAL